MKKWMEQIIIHKNKEQKKGGGFHPLGDADSLSLENQHESDLFSPTSFAVILMKKNGGTRLPLGRISH